MICTNCSNLVFLNTRKNCVKCRGEVLNNLSVMCDNCSNTIKQCAVCLKKILPPSKQSKGCGCGNK